MNFFTVSICIDNRGAFNEDQHRYAVHFDSEYPFNYGQTVGICDVLCHKYLLCFRKWEIYSPKV